MKLQAIHPANSRGTANHGWLKTNFSFSFAHYYNPEKIHFGALRVLNDDHIEGGMGFGTHPHDNMEIVTIPLEGDLRHKDSMGNQEVIRQHDVQIMSAGKGVRHSEYNHNPDRPVKLLQIWVFPKEWNIQPRYEQKTFRPEDRVNRLQFVVSPTHPEAVWINQDAYFSLGNLEKGRELTYQVQKPGNGVYAFLISGQVELPDIRLNRRDAVGITDVKSIPIKVLADSEILLIEVPMTLPGM